MTSHMPLQSEAVPVDGTRLLYELTGNGQPVVFLHAGICDLRMWDEQVPAFARHFRVLRYDRRGFGRSPLGTGPYSHRQDLAALLDQLELERVSLVGCSQGGRIAVDFALEAPERVERLVLVSPALSGFPYTVTPPRQFAEIEAAEVRGDLETVNELELQVWVDGPFPEFHKVDVALRERVREMNRIALSAPVGVAEEQPVPSVVERLETIVAPTLLLVGELDEEHTRATARAIHARVPQSRSITVAGVAHLPNMEQPRLFNDLVLHFLGVTRSLG